MEAGAIPRYTSKEVYWATTVMVSSRERYSTRGVEERMRSGWTDKQEQKRSHALTADT
jgi:hypothetical protein